MRSKRVVPAVLCAVGLAVLGGFLGASGCRKEEPASALEVTPDPIDFGDVNWGDVVQKSVSLRNRSSHAVTLKDPEFDCPCYALARPPTVSRLDPGQSVDVIVVLRSQLAKHGVSKKNFAVRSDDPAKPRLDVPVTVNVVMFRSIEPERLDFGLTDALGASVEKTVKVRAEHGFRVAVTRATFTPVGRPAGTEGPAVDVEVRPAEGGADVVVRTKKGAKGLLSGEVRLDLDVVRLDLDMKDERGGHRTVTESVWVQGEAR